MSGALTAAGVCHACAEELPAPDAERCLACGEFLGEREPEPSPGYGRDSVAVAVICTVGTALAIALVAAL